MLVFPAHDHSTLDNNSLSPQRPPLFSCSILPPPSTPKSSFPSAIGIFSLNIFSHLVTPGVVFQDHACVRASGTRSTEACRCGYRTGTLFSGLTDALFCTSLSDPSMRKTPVIEISAPLWEFFFLSKAPPFPKYRLSFSFFFLVPHHTHHNGGVVEESSPRRSSAGFPPPPQDFPLSALRSIRRFLWYVATPFRRITPPDIDSPE